MRQMKTSWGVTNQRNDEISAVQWHKQQKTRKARKSRKLRGHLYNFQKVLVPLITYTSRKDGLQIDSLSFSRAKIWIIELFDVYQRWNENFDFDHGWR